MSNCREGSYFRNPAYEFKRKKRNQLIEACADMTRPQTLTGSFIFPPHGQAHFLHHQVKAHSKNKQTNRNRLLMSMRTTLLIKVIVQKRLPLLEQTFTRMKVNVQINPNGHDIYTSVQERKKKRRKKGKKKSKS